MENRNRANVRILLVDGDAYMRQGVSNALANEGYRDVRTMKRLSLLRDVVIATIPDLLIVDIDMPDGDPIELMRDIRNGKLGRNPFLQVIFTSWSADRALIRHAIDSGVDALLVKPLSPAQLFARIDRLVTGRNPFVVTADYIGPDRRQDTRTDDCKSFDVPNTLKDKIEGRPLDPPALQREIDEMLAQINESRLEQSALKIAYLAHTVTNSFAKKKITKQTKVQVGEIIQNVGDITHRARGEKAAKLAELCKSLLGVARHIHKRPKKADPKQVELLKPLSESMILCTNPNLNCELATHEIIEMVGNYSSLKEDRLSTIA